MDLVDYSEEVFKKIKSDLIAFSSKLNVNDIHFLPISALNGDNVVNQSKNMDWYQGSTLMYLLENIHIGSDYNHIDCRFPVQYVIRPKSEKFPDYRAYAGRIAGGVFKPGDEIAILHSGFMSKIKSIDTMGGSLEQAYAPMSVSITLEDDIDVIRGDMIVRANNQSNVEQDIDVMICWLNEKNMVLNGKYAIKHTSNDVRCIIKEIN
jgi:sulfate adenylyltransferase subunit 1